MVPCGAGRSRMCAWRRKRRRPPSLGPAILWEELKQALLARRGPLQSVEERAAEPPSCLGTYRKASAAWSPTDSTSYLTTNRTPSRCWRQQRTRKKKPAGAALGALGPRAQPRPQPKPTPARQANSCERSPRKTARTRCPPASAWLTRRRRRSRPWRWRKKVEPWSEAGSRAEGGRQRGLAVADASCSRATEPGPARPEPGPVPAAVRAQERARARGLLPSRRAPGAGGRGARAAARVAGVRGASLRPFRPRGTRGGAGVRTPRPLRVRGSQNLGGHCRLGGRVCCIVPRSPSTLWETPNSPAWAEPSAGREGRSAAGEAGAGKRPEAAPRPRSCSRPPARGSRGAARASWEGRAAAVTTERSPRVREAWARSHWRALVASGRRGLHGRVLSLSFAFALIAGLSVIVGGKAARWGQEEASTISSEV